MTRPAIGTVNTVVQIVCPAHLLPLVRTKTGEVCLKCRLKKRKDAFQEMRYGGSLRAKPKPYTPTRRVKKVHIEDVRRLQAAGMTNAAIAQRLGVKPPAVSQCIARARAHGD